jgi:hypothetical protein
MTKRPPLPRLRRGYANEEWLLRNLRITSLCAESDEGRREGQGGAGLWLEEVPVPEVRGDDVLIRALKMWICGTDVTA